jgi:imidazolonepropionase-like amidohydrolase
MTATDSLHSSSRFLLRSSRIFTGTSSEAGGLVTDGIVEVRDGRIGYIGPAANLPQEVAAARLPTLDYGDATLMPGMVDAHCHITLTGDGSTYEEQVLDPDEMLSLISVSNLQRHLAAGVTTIRDNGGRNRVVFVVREAIKRGYIRGPRMLLAGRPVTHSYGHFYWCNGVADGIDEIKAAVRRLVAEGADHIKIMASGGATLGNLPYYASYETDELRAAVETAHGLGRLTTAHCRATTSMENALEAGLDCIEHAEFLEPGGMLEFGAGVASSGLMVYNPAVTERIHKQGTFVSFTAQTGGHETLLKLRAGADRGHADAGSLARISALEAYFDMKLGILSSMLNDDLGDVMAISTDAGPYDVSFGGLAHGAGLAVAAGMTPLAALRAVTSVPARACGIADDLGTLETGKVADVLAIGGDVTTDIAKLWDVQAVYQGGHLVAPLVAKSAVDERRPSLQPNPRHATVPDC